MTTSPRLTALSVLSLLAACSSTDPGTKSEPGGASGAATGAGGTAAGGQATTGAGGSTASGGQATTGGTGPGSGGTGGTGSGGAAAGSGGTGGVTPPVDCSGITAAGYELCSSSPSSCEAVFTNGAGCEAVCAAAGLTCASALENVDDACAADESLPGVACNSGHQSDYCVCSGPSTGAGGTSGTGGSSSGGAGGSGGSPPVGDLSITDPVPGFASVGGGTTGGGTNLGSAITVNTMSALQNAAEGDDPAIILVEPGNYSGTLQPGANKTIVGIAPGVTINGNIDISGSDVSNVIIRNLAVKGLPCSSYDECRAGDDAVYMGSGAHHIWLDHLDIADGQDGNCDATQAADYITVSWTHFHYTYDKEHRFSNLIAGSDDEPQSAGKLRITYMNSHWGERVNSRQPRGRYGNVHMLNNYHNTGGGQIHGVGKDMALIAENNYYDEDISIFTDMGSPRGWKGVGNAGSADNMSASMGTVFTIPYSYTAMPASEVVDAVTSPNCGAGNTCTFAH